MSSGFSSRLIKADVPVFLMLMVHQMQILAPRPLTRFALALALVCGLAGQAGAQAANVGLTVVFYKAIGENKKLLRVVVPLGVLLPTGLGLKIDNEDVGNAPFLKCGKRGCVAEVVLQDEVINKLKKGENAMFIIFDTPEAGIGIPVSLQGFSDAFAGLK